MSQVFVHGYGAVSPAGWSAEFMRKALQGAQSVTSKEISRPGWPQPLRVRRVPTPESRPLFTSHPRLRRTSPITQFAVAAALEALGGDAALVTSGKVRLGIVFCVMSGCVNYSRRFYDEALRDPSTASPLVFPETVFNAPSSHLAAMLGTSAINYTLVGDPGTFLQGLALAADWLTHEAIEACLVVGAEEIDWLTADAFRLFADRVMLSEGAGALYLRENPGRHSPALRLVTDAHLFDNRWTRLEAARAMRSQLPAGGAEDLLCDGRQNLRRLDEPEDNSWRKWPGARLSLKIQLGEGLMASAAWQCVAALDALRQGAHSSAMVSVVGCNQQAIGAHFTRF